MAAAIALALSYAGCETALHFGRKHNWDPAGAVAGFHVRSFGSEVVPEVASADVVALATFPEAVDDYRVTYAALLNASLAADGPLLLLMVHQPYLLPQHVPRTHPVWDAARRGRAVLLASGPHVARALAATVREHAGFEPPPISVVVNIPAASPPTAAVTKREHLCVQGKPEKSRRHYGLLFLALRHPSVHSMLRILNESLLLIGTRQRTAQNDLAQIPEDLPVRAVEDLPFTEFFSLLARCRAIITAFAHPRYVAEQSSSSVTTALHVGTPLLLESRALDSYNYLDRRGLWIYDDAAKWEQGSVPGPTTLPTAMGKISVEAAAVGELKPGEMKEVKVGAGKALLSRVGDEYFATSHLCTHYKAPLVKGTLSQDGRIMCPWHGACFSAKTGDIEDAPGLDALNKYTVTVKGGKVFVEADEDQVKEGRRVPTVCKRDASSAKKVVILGGGAAGEVAVEGLREAGYTGAITMVSREGYLPIDRPKLSKALNPPLDSVLLRKEEFFKDLGVDLLLGTEATSVDPKAKSVKLSTGEQLSYDYLIIATGGDPRTLPVPGADLKEIHVLRGIQDSAGIDDSLKAAKAAAGSEDYKPKIVIVGSSFIGMEMAAIAAKQADITVVGMEKVPFERVLGEKIGSAFQAIGEKAGLKFRMESVTDRYEPSEKDPSKVGSVVLKSGEVLPADMVVLGVGVKCATDFLKSSGLALERDGSILVDATMKSPDDSIYVLGDIARYPYHMTPGETVRVEHWSVAQNQARVAARNIAKRVSGEAGDEKFEHIPYFWSVQYGRSLRYCGHALHFDDVIVRSDDLEEGFEAYYANGEKILAVASLARDPVVTKASELMRLGKMPSATEIKNGADILKLPLGEPPVSAKSAASPSSSSESSFDSLRIPIILGSIIVVAIAYFLANQGSSQKA
ncbi:hypothetical protein DFJ74DRAFT_773484 [Hyaloraphidium curvatum]|nr:hypothetical protein DFJ74DRAFT_773484 [Hyaloraphidium curvatum]